MDVSAAAERCESDVLDDFPEVRGAFVATLHCEIAAAERREPCLARAATCGEAEACSAPPDGGATDCEALASPKAGAVADFTAAVRERCAGR